MLHRLQLLKEFGGTLIDKKGICQVYYIWLSKAKILNSFCSMNRLGTQVGETLAGMHAHVLLDTMTSHSLVNSKFTTRIGLHVVQDHDKVVLSNSAKNVDVEGHVIGHVNVRVKV